MGNDAHKTHSAIDKAYDYADRVVEGVGRVLGVDVTEPSHATADLSPRGKVIELPASAAKALPAPAAGAAAPRGPHAEFYVLEAFDAQTGKTIVILTNGKTSRTVASRAYAEEVIATIARAQAARAVPA